MKIDLIHIILLLTSIVLFGACSVLVFYIRKKMVPILAASDESAELFTRLDTYGNHLKSVYQLNVSLLRDFHLSLIEICRSFDFYQRLGTFCSF